jgi:hypothetical protein
MSRPGFHSFRNNPENAGRVAIIPGIPTGVSPITTNPLTTAPEPRKLLKGDLIRINDGVAKLRDGSVPPPELLVTDLFTANRRWSEQKVIEVELETEEGLRDIDELNAAIPQESWERGLDGKPRAPWERVFGLYMTDTREAGSYTFLNSTFGARLAFERLRERIGNMSRIRNQAVLPIVRITGKPMKTNFGTRTRPEFEVVSWVPANGITPPAAIGFVDAGAAS